MSCIIQINTQAGRSFIVEFSHGSMDVCDHILQHGKDLQPLLNFAATAKMGFRPSAARDTVPHALYHTQGVFSIIDLSDVEKSLTVFGTAKLDSQLQLLSMIIAGPDFSVYPGRKSYLDPTTGQCIGYSFDYAWLPRSDASYRSNRFVGNHRYAITAVGNKLIMCYSARTPRTALLDSPDIEIKISPEARIGMAAAYERAYSGLWDRVLKIPEVAAMATQEYQNQHLEDFIEEFATQHENLTEYLAVEETQEIAYDYWLRRKITSHASIITALGALYSALDQYTRRDLCRPGLIDFVRKIYADHKKYITVLDAADKLVCNRG